MKNIIQKYWKELLSLLYGVVAWLVWNNLYWGHIQYQELLQMFLFDTDYLIERISVAGGLADYIGEFLTQFYYIHYSGALIIALMLVAFQRGVWTVAKNSGAQSQYYFLSFLPSVLLWSAMCNEDMLLSLPVALMLVVIAILIAQYIKSEKTKTVYTLLVTPLLYWLAGPAHFVFVLWTVCNMRNIKRELWKAVLIIFIACLVPYIASFYLHYPTQKIFLGLNYSRSYDDIPPLMLISAFSFALIPWTMTLLPEIRKQMIVKISYFATVLYLIGGGLIASQMDTKREEIFQYHQLICRGKWEKVIAMADKESPTEPLAVCCLNLALGKMGMLTDRMFHYYQSNIQTLLPIYTSDFVAPIISCEVMYHLGLINETQRYAFEGIQSTLNYRKSARLYKRLAETNLLNGNYKVAERYLMALQKTVYYRTWAVRTMEYVRNPELIVQNPEWKMLLDYRIKEDFLFDEHQMTAILYQLVSVNPNNTLALEMLYAHLLLSHDFETLVDCLALMNRAGYKRIPQGIQEAVLYYWRERYDDYSQLPFTPSQDIVRKIEDFARALNYAPDKKQTLEDYFGNTYWYYLFRISK